MSCSKAPSVSYGFAFELKGTLLDAFTLEQKLLKENSHCRVNLSIGTFSSTEIFTKDIFNGEYPWKL